MNMVNDIGWMSTKQVTAYAFSPPSKIAAEQAEASVRC